MDLMTLAPHWHEAINTPEYNSAIQLAQLLESHGFEAYIVGGAVRDILLGKTPKDVDIVTNARPDELLAVKGLEKASFKDTSQAYAVTRLHFHGQMFEVATFRRDVNAHKGRKLTEVEYATLQEDIQRRDFTINALALQPSTGKIIDEMGGVADLLAKFVCFIGEPIQRIQEDPLRVIRAVRFKTALNFQYEEKTYHAIKTAVKQDVVETIAIDRLRQELTRMLVAPTRAQTIIDLDKLGILQRVLPEVTAGKGVQQPKRYHAEGDVWQHQLEVLRVLPPYPSPQLVWAALLHDIGKGPAREGEGEEATFHNHYHVGADMARALLKRLNFSKRDIEAITWMIYHHMNIDDLPKMRRSKQLEMLSHPSFADLLLLHKVDAAASWPGKKRETPVFFPQLEQLWFDYQAIPYEQRQPSLKHDVGIDGHWLKQKFNITSGVQIGNILSELQSWYRDTGIKDVEAYRQKVKDLLGTDK